MAPTASGVRALTGVAGPASAAVAERMMAEGQNLEWTWAPLKQRAMAIIGDGMTAAVNGEVPLVDMFADAQTEIVEIMRGIGLYAVEAR